MTTLLSKWKTYNFSMTFIERIADIVMFAESALKAKRWSFLAIPTNRTIFEVIY